ncbi:MAG: DUF302 domain-containing protein [Acidobacteria bacterium]|jgi:uncharacterized protein (DUF302 family)|nr:DUF302 domain-containing protein [Acidobacteriota bacterium]MCU0253112.1 DUF302 domain-containing protein [Acidobacteriota bacterium]
MLSIALLAALAGLAAGAALGIASVVRNLRSKMIVATELPLKFEDAERRLVDKVPNVVPGWGFPIPDFDFVAALAKRGHKAEGIRRAKVFFLCNPAYASRVVGAETRMIGMMPCHWALYETDGGRVFLSKLNIPMMAKLFTGPVGAAMTQVGRDEEQIIRALTE